MTAGLRWANWVMCALLLLAVVVQLNDPDPLQWVAVYSAAFGVSLVSGARGRVPVAAAVLVAAVAVLWGASIMIGGPGAGEYPHMFDAWEMKSAPIEEAREASGLLLAGAWMLVLTIAQLRGGQR